MDKPKLLKRIRSGVVERGFGLAKTAFSVGASSAGHWIEKAWESNEDKINEKFKALITGQAKLLATQMHEMKGSVMKMGQMFSVYGEYFLPREANEILKSLQSQSPALEWEAVAKILDQELGPKLLDLEVEAHPIAAASMSQVHRAVWKKSDKKLAVKIQYPGVDKAIDGDIRMLKTALSFSKLVPQIESLSPVFFEIREMLHRELKFDLERETMECFIGLLKGDGRFVVPKPVAELCTPRLLASEFEPGLRVDDKRVLELPLAERNSLAQAFLELYFLEILKFGKVQTDPHFGNYAIRLGPPHQIVLYDFGALREYSPEFIAGYKNMLRGIINNDNDRFREGCTQTGVFKKPLSETQWDYFRSFCQLVCEPFLKFRSTEFHDSEGRYLWAKSDLPMRLVNRLGEFKSVFKTHSPPRDFIFLDRKVSGMFIVFAKLASEFDPRPHLEKHL
jgi:predicted unusual protein kinase regulating ubiquinone biosynthesis (AarF/ABC1/UbiB family)